MDIYLSGRFTTGKKIEKAWIKRTGCKARCFAFPFVNEEKTIPGYYNPKVTASLKVWEESGQKIMMDSGAYSLHSLVLKKNKGKLPKAMMDFDLETMQNNMYEAYVRFCLAHKDKWEFYVTLDFVKDQNVIYAMQQKFKSRGLLPVAAYHGDSNLDWLKKHRDMGNNYICIGGLHLHKGTKKYYLDKVFNFGAKHGLVYHGLAMTSMDLLTSYPFKSVDSSTWSQTAAYGIILYPNVRKRKFLNIHVSENFCQVLHTHHTMTRKHKEQLSEFVGHHGFDLKRMETSEDERHDWNGYLMSNLEKFGVIPDLRKSWGTLV